jgi:hypothetical protein
LQPGTKDSSTRFDEPLSHIESTLWIQNLVPGTEQPSAYHPSNTQAPENRQAKVQVANSVWGDPLRFPSDKSSETQRNFFVYHTLLSPERGPGVVSHSGVIMKLPGPDRQWESR